MVLIRERFFERLIEGIFFFSLKDRILCLLKEVSLPEISVTLECLISSSSASFKERVLGEPLLFVKRLSVMRS